MAARRTRDVLLCVLVGLVTTCAAVGWLYLLRGAHGLATGPRIGGALPLQRLAGDAQQPLLRFLAAWLPAGVAAGAALAALAPGLGRPARAAATGITALVTLALAGAASDAITANETVRAHAASQVQHGATWLAALLLAACALVAVAPARARAR